MGSRNGSMVLPFWRASSTPKSGVRGGRWGGKIVVSATRKFHSVSTHSYITHKQKQLRTTPHFLICKGLRICRKLRACEETSLAQNGEFLQDRCDSIVLRGCLPSHCFTMRTSLTNAKPLAQQVNFNKAQNFIRSAAQQGCDLAVLPEYHLNSYVPHDPGFVEACSLWQTYLEAYQRLAKELNICIVPGTIVQTETAAGEDPDTHNTLPHSPDVGTTARSLPTQVEPIYNVAYFISNDGTIAGSYTKKNLWGAERLHQASSGRAPHPVIDTPLGKIGLLICWDLAFPEAFRELIAAGAKIVIIPTFWKLDDCSPAGRKYNASAEALFLDSTVTSRAFENTCAVVFCNAGGPAGEAYAGLSQIAAPFVGPLVRLGNSTEGMAVVDLDMELIEEAERNYQVRADIAMDDWHYDYRHDKEREHNVS
ncbi:hypothetical protein FH972_021821 [Carpinus fangiana]|uniref:CN hydrolase domain-containing protein n=1 Tax=Carpinus fangiana TaxID=176857 RepID=A0A5N6KQT3_9ROSI|nr:hypothetical protein FH972_021821 [Carpinus fangiana]